MKKGKENKTIALFKAFFKIGLFTFGGGYAMIPLIRREIVENRKWISDADLLDITAIAESTPGPIAINSATFVGNKVAGFRGSLAATFGVVLPSFCIIYVVSFVLRQFEDLAVIRYAFTGVRAGVLALIINAFFSMYKQCPRNLVSCLLMAAAFILSVFTDLSVIYVIIGCGLMGLASYEIARKRKP